MKPGFFPYTIYDGKATLFDSTLSRVWNKLWSDGAAAGMFIEGDIRSEKDFITMAKNPRTHFVLIYDHDDETFTRAPDDYDFVGVFWLNRVEKCRAAVHFAIFKWAKKYSRAIGRASIGYCFSLKWPDGTGLDLLWGVIPSCNKAAIRYALACGADYGCVMPNYFWRASEKKSEDGTLLLYKRGKHEDLL